MTGGTVTGVYDEGGTQLFAQSHSMRLQVQPTSKMPQHPLEDGTSVTDARIILPVEATLVIIVTGATLRTTYDEVKTAFNTGATLSVFCAAGFFNNLVISAMPHDESADMLDAVPIMLRLSEVQFFKAQAQAITATRPKATKATNTAQRGEQSPSAKPRESVAYKLFN